MTERHIMCHKLGRTLPALKQAPYPGALGERIYNEISAEAWESWLSQQTMLINEYRLSLINPEARKFLQTEMMRFLFEGVDTKPPGFTEND